MNSIVPRPKIRILSALRGGAEPRGRLLQHRPVDTQAVAELLQATRGGDQAGRIRTARQRAPESILAVVLLVQIRKKGMCRSCGFRAFGTRSGQYESLQKRRPARSTIMACGMAYSGPLAKPEPSAEGQPGTSGTVVGGIWTTAPPTASQSDRVAAQTFRGHAAEVLGLQVQEFTNEIRVPVVRARCQHHGPVPLDRPVLRRGPDARDAAVRILRYLGDPMAQQHLELTAAVEETGEEAGDEAGAEGQRLRYGGCRISDDSPPLGARCAASSGSSSAVTRRPFSKRSA